MSEVASGLKAGKVRKPKPWWLGAIFVAIGIAILLALGTWQMQRLRWKEDLLARIERLHNAPPVPIETVLGRPAKDLDFVRVSANCPDIGWQSPLQLYSILDGEAGVRLIQRCKVGSRTLLVDTGFAKSYAEAAIGGPADEARRKESLRLREPITGVLRIPSKRNAFTPRNDPHTGVWYSVDIPLMADSDRTPIPLVLMLESPKVGPADPAPIPKEISNRHLEYALTWYGLAVALAGVYIALLLRRRSS